MLGNLHDYDPKHHAVPYAELPELDRYMLGRLAEVGVGARTRTRTRARARTRTRTRTLSLGLSLSPSPSPEPESALERRR
jgi:hypothetical protein